jgi:hypothetical protein
MEGEQVLARGRRGSLVLVKRGQRWKGEGVQIGQTKKTTKAKTTRRAQPSSADPGPHLRGAGYRAGLPGSVRDRDLPKVRRGEIRWTMRTRTRTRTRMGDRRRNVRECSAPSDSYRVKWRRGGGSEGGDFEGERVQ